MKTKEKETKKSLSVAELESELRTAQEKKFRLTFKHRERRSSQIDNPMEIRKLRRNIARLKTWINEKQALASGESK